jgi:hypothetical protein
MPRCRSHETNCQVILELALDSACGYHMAAPLWCERHESGFQSGAASTSKALIVRRQDVVLSA